jgi:hypothetical protein
LTHPIGDQGQLKQKSSNLSVFLSSLLKQPHPSHFSPHFLQNAARIRQSRPDRPESDEEEQAEHGGLEATKAH